MDSFLHTLLYALVYYGIWGFASFIIIRQAIISAYKKIRKDYKDCKDCINYQKNNPDLKDEQRDKEVL